MSRLPTLIALTAVVSTAACTLPTYEADPVSVYQWERRQQAIERQQAERERLCRITKDEDPRKEELCRGVEREKD
jgi:cytochrome c556